MIAALGAAKCRYLSSHPLFPGGDYRGVARVSLLNAIYRLPHLAQVVSAALGSPVLYTCLSCVMCPAYPGSPVLVHLSWVIIFLGLLVFGRLSWNRLSDT